MWEHGFREPYHPHEVGVHLKFYVLVVRKFNRPADSHPGVVYEHINLSLRGNHFIDSAFHCVGIPHVGRQIMHSGNPLHIAPYCAINSISLPGKQLRRLQSETGRYPRYEHDFSHHPRRKISFFKKNQGMNKTFLVIPCKFKKFL